MPHYFVSDVHLRNDRPDRDRRFRAWLNRLTHHDELFIAGDLCDFWMGSRRAHEDPLESESLRALAEFRRGGGSLRIMAGNHDEWLCPFYQAELGATIVSEPYQVTSHGIRLRIVHGHLMGARRAWKAWMEGQAFFDAFSHVPGPLARALDQVLAWRNRRGLNADEERHLHVYRQYAAKYDSSADVVVFGHVHRAVDDARTSPRLIVLGGWHYRSSFLKIDEAGATFHVEHDPEPEPHAIRPPCPPSSNHPGELDEV